MKDLLSRYGALLTTVFFVLTGFWLLILVVLPNIYLFETSFRPYLPMAEVGGPKDFYSFDNYLTFFQSPIHISVFFWTIIYSSFVTIICFVIAYPMAFYLSKIADNKLLPTIFLLLFIPLWVSEVLCRRGPDRGDAGQGFRIQGLGTGRAALVDPDRTHAPGRIRVPGHPPAGDHEAGGGRDSGTL